jgi:hypothetical protein
MKKLAGFNDDGESWWRIGKNRRILFDRPKPTVGCSAKKKNKKKKKLKDAKIFQKSWSKFTTTYNDYYFIDYMVTRCKFCRPYYDFTVYRIRILVLVHVTKVYEGLEVEFCTLLTWTYMEFIGQFYALIALPQGRAVRFHWLRGWMVHSDSLHLNLSLLGIEPRFVVYSAISLQYMTTVRLLLRFMLQRISLERLVLDEAWKPRHYYQFWIRHGCIPAAVFVKGFGKGSVAYYPSWQESHCTTCYVCTSTSCWPILSYLKTPFYEYYPVFFVNFRIIKRSGV